MKVKTACESEAGMLTMNTHCKFNPLTGRCTGLTGCDVITVKRRESSRFRANIHVACQGVVSGLCKRGRTNSDKRWLTEGDFEDLATLALKKSR